MQHRALRLASIIALPTLLAGCGADPGRPPSIGFAEASGPEVGQAHATEEAFPGRHGPVHTFRMETSLGPRDVTYEVIDGVAVTEGDILLGPAGGPAPEGELARSVGRTDTSYRWPNGQVPFEIDGAFDAATRTQLTSAMAHWNDRTPYWFRPRNGDGDYIRFIRGAGCWSYVGRQGGRQDISIGQGCDLGATIHELGHAVGLWHEQSRADRGNFVTVQWANIQAGQAYNFETYTQQGEDGRDMFDYDFGSIMHYGATAFSSNGLPTLVRRDGRPLVTQRAGLSTTDIAGAVRLLTNTHPQPTFTLRLAHSGLCLDVAAASRAPQAAVNQYTCHGQANQRWHVWTVPGTSRLLVLNDWSGQCLDIPGGTRTSGALLQQYPCHGFDSQQFERVYRGSAFALRNAASGLCLDVPDASTASGRRLQQYACHFGANQLFRIVY
ncbi:MAG: RICIN domain-containing protein [Deltaproteobacteria bacterium]|nr:RICIN domain-containing protein [Deltaproteobacteria bacterium]